MKAKKSGRAKASFVQTRRLDNLRDALETQTQGHTLEALANLLGVTERSVRRYLGQLGRSVELESIELTRGGAHAWRIKPSARARTLPLRRSQAYALLAARSVFEPRELPVGIVTAIIGAPLFAVLLGRRRSAT